MTYKKIILKISGESMKGPGSKNSIDLPVVRDLAREIKEVQQMGVQVSIVIGGGNIFRGAAGESEGGIDRAQGDYMGMLATVINSLALQDALEKEGVMTRVMTAVNISQIAEPYIRRRAIRHLEKGRVVILASGTGNPYFSTDTAASLRAMEIGAEVILKGTKVDGVYDSDPVKNPDAKLYEELSYLTVLQKDLRVMDVTSISMCMDNNLPIIVFNMFKKGNLKKVIAGEKVGTKVHG